MASKRRRLGDLLIESGRLNETQLQKALGVQKKTGEHLDEILTNLGYMSEEDIVEILEFQLGVPHVDLSTQLLAKEIALLIPVTMAERHHVIPIKKEGQRITLALQDPTNFFAIDDVQMFTGCEIDPVIATGTDITRAINSLYGVGDRVEKAVNQLKQVEKDATRDIQVANEAAPIVSIVNSLISQAIKEKVSDIHIEPLDKGLRVRYRIDGVLREVANFPIHTHAAILSRIKIMSEMDIAEKRLPQDGRIKFHEAGRDVDIRVSSLPTILGEKAVLRILDKQNVILDVDQLGFRKDNLAQYRNLYHQSYGMILVTGPTGSGKTTTLYSTLTQVNTDDKNIITVEDPVEYMLDGINQVQVNPKAGLTFTSGLRSILRQDPNVVMIGEIRDSETADIAIRAALTGHLVFSTLHTNDASGAITRLIDMGVEPFLVASSILGVVAQRLVRLICPECKTSYIPPADSVERSFLGVAAGDDLVLYHGLGCSACGNTGYRGRMAIQEVMLATPHIRELINKRASTNMLTKAACEEGMLVMRQDGIEKAKQGLTTIAEIMRVAYSEL